jgi:putative redox protein
MSVRITGETTGKTTTRLRHVDSGSVLETMAPKDNGGEGLLFSPTDLCAASLASCGTTIMNMYANNAGIPVARIEFEVTKEMVANPRRIGRLTVTYRIHTGCEEREFRKLIAAGKTCPIRKTLHPDVELVEEYVRVRPDDRRD